MTSDHPPDSQHITITINQETSLATDFDIEAYITTILNLLNITQGSFEFSFVDEDTISTINKSHLNRSYITDIITFNLEDPDQPIIGDIYICPQKAAENAKELSHPLSTELKTLIIHGILHLLGYEDYTPEDKATMFEEQNRLLKLADQ